MASTLTAQDMLKLSLSQMAPLLTNGSQWGHNALGDQIRILEGQRPRWPRSPRPATLQVESTVFWRARGLAGLKVAGAGDPPGYGTVCVPRSFSKAQRQDTVPVQVGAEYGRTFRLSLRFFQQVGDNDFARLIER